jgi:hypothetical protein
MQPCACWCGPQKKRELKQFLFVNTSGNEMAAVQRALKAAKEAEARSYNERRSLSKVYETLGTPQHSISQ